MAQKKPVQIAIRFSDAMLKVTDKVMARRKVGSLPDYLRGLILLDAGDHDPHLIAGQDVPAWVTRDRRYRGAMKAAAKPKRD